MKKQTLLLYVILLCNLGFSQSKKFEKLLKRNLKQSVPVLRISEVLATEDYVLLDTREEKEFKTSHLKNANQVGYDFFDIETVIKNYPDKTQPILVYCSIGLRSELVGEKLLKAGYTDVHNLYGGVFEWKNQSHEVVDQNEKSTEKIHTFSKEWSKWLTNGEKVYEK
jgi:rhodanese-related sulfurtransferase